MKNIKISNELLSSVFGCECEFERVINLTTNKNEVTIKYIKYIDIQSFSESINLDTFIRLAQNGNEMYTQERDLNMLEDALSNGKLNGFKRK